MKQLPIVIIGGGVMGGAIAERLIKDEYCKPPEMSIVERDANRRVYLSQTLPGVHILPKMVKLQTSEALVLLAIKPQDSHEAFIQLKEAGFVQGMVVSVMAGIKLAKLQREFPQAHIIRAMPNIAVAVGEGVIGWASSSEISTEEREIVEGLFASLGKHYLLDEDQLDAITAISGSGPAYLYMFVTDILNAARALNLGDQLTSEIVKQTIVGAAMLYQIQNIDAITLANKVTSKGGSTQAAREVLNQYHSSEMWQKAILAAYHRSQEIGSSSDDKK